MYRQRVLRVRVSLPPTRVVGLAALVTAGLSLSLGSIIKCFDRVEIGRSRFNILEIGNGNAASGFRSGSYWGGSDYGTCCVVWVSVSQLVFSVQF